MARACTGASCLIPEGLVVIPGEHEHAGIAEPANGSARATDCEPNAHGADQPTACAYRKRSPTASRTAEDRDRDRRVAVELSDWSDLDVRRNLCELGAGVAQCCGKSRVCDSEAPSVSRNHSTQPTISSLGLDAPGGQPI
jgi:hypothetical protein